MLTLIKRKGSPYWYVRGTVYGQSVYASTKETDKASARRFKDALEVRLARASGEKCHVATFREAAALYLEARPPSPQWQADIMRLCAVIGDRPLVDIKHHILVDAASMLYRDYLPASKNCNVFGPAAAVIHYAAENALCPDVRIGKLKEKRPEPRAMRKEDAVRLIAVADGKMRLLLVFLFAQGWRISDTLRLTWQDVDLSQATVRYHISKTDEMLTMPLHLAVLNMLRDEPAHIGRVFPWRNRAALYRQLRPLCRTAGVAFTPHCARHSFATWLAADGASTKEAWRRAHGGITGPFFVIRASMKSAPVRRSIGSRSRMNEEPRTLCKLRAKVEIW
jgi:integrase